MNNFIDSFKYCEKQLKLYDEDFWLIYSLFTKKERLKILPILVFYTELNKLVNQSKEFSITQIRLEFWRSTIEDFKKNKIISHPIAILLSNFIKKYGFYNEIINIINSQEKMTSGSCITTYKELDNFSLIYGGDFLKLLGKVLFNEIDSNKVILSSLKDIGSAYALIRVVRQFKFDIYNNRVLFPIEEINSLGFNKDQLLIPKNLDYLLVKIGANILDSALKKLDKNQIRVNYFSPIKPLLTICYLNKLYIKKLNFRENILSKNIYNINSNKKRIALAYSFYFNKY